MNFLNTETAGPGHGIAGTYARLFIFSATSEKNLSEFSAFSLFKTQQTVSTFKHILKAVRRSDLIRRRE